MVKDKYVVITSNGNKKRILMDIVNNKLLYNIKFYTFLELKKKLFFDYDNNTLEYIIKNYNVNIKIAKIYLDNMYFLKDLDDAKVKFLNKLKQELDNGGLLIRNGNFKKSLINTKIIVYGRDFLSREEKLILDDIGFPYELKSDNRKTYVPNIYEAINMNEEVEFVASRISELLNRNIDINNIKIIASSDYDNTLKRYFKIFKIPLNLDGKNSFYSTLVAQDFLDNYDNKDIKDNIIKLQEKYSNANDLVNIINKSVLIKDKMIRKEFIIEDLKMTSVKSKLYDKAVEVIDIQDYISDDDYVFLLGFNIGCYPKIFKDEDFLSDKIKELLGLDTSSIKNKNAKLELVNKIHNIKNLVITYKNANARGVFYPSLIISEEEIEVKKIFLEQNVSYSILNSNLRYAKDLDNLYKFNIISEELSLYSNNLEIPYRKYSNKFQGIDLVALKNRLEGNLVLSYTSIEEYYECAFKYYLGRILNLNIYEDSFKTIIGNIVHHILELYAKNNKIDVNVEAMKFIKDKEYVLSAKEYFYLERICLEIKDMIVIINEQMSQGKLNKLSLETELYVYKDREEFKVTIKGLIDKIMYNEREAEEVLAVVDYKTGNTLITLDNLEYGLNMQLPIYLYLLKNSERFRKASIAGFYIQKVMDNIPNIDSKKSLMDIKRENMRLNGYSNSDTNILAMLDKDYQDSKIIKNLKYKKDGSISSKAKVLSNKDMDELIDLVDIKIESIIDNIISGNFDINPKVVKNKNNACMYCKFKDICFMNKSDEIVIGGDKNEVDSGTGTSNI